MDAILAFPLSLFLSFLTNRGGGHTLTLSENESLRWECFQCYLFLECCGVATTFGYFFRFASLCVGWNMLEHEDEGVADAHSEVGRIPNTFNYR